MDRDKIFKMTSFLCRDALTEAENSCEEICLVIPDICKDDFEVFQSALFAQERDNSIDAFVVIRTAEILGVDFVRFAYRLTLFSYKV